MQPLHVQWAGVDPHHPPGEQQVNPLNRAQDIFWIKSLLTFHFKKCIWPPVQLWKSAIFANFQKRLVMCHVSTSSQKAIITFEKFFLVWVPMNIQKVLKVKLESDHHKVASRDMSRLVADKKIFRLFMKGKCDAYVLWNLTKSFQDKIVDRSTARNFMVCIRLCK